MLASWVTVSLAAIRVARTWTAGADIPWRVAGISAWVREGVASGGSVGHGVLGILGAYVLAVWTQQAGLTIAAACAWVGGASALGGG